MEITLAGECTLRAIAARLSGRSSKDLATYTFFPKSLRGEERSPFFFFSKSMGPLMAEPGLPLNIEPFRREHLSPNYQPPLQRVDFFETEDGDLINPGSVSSILISHDHDGEAAVFAYTSKGPVAIAYFKDAAVARRLTEFLPELLYQSGHVLRWEAISDAVFEGRSTESLIPGEQIRDRQRQQNIEAQRTLRKQMSGERHFPPRDRDHG